MRTLLFVGIAIGMVMATPAFAVEDTQAIDAENTQAIDTDEKTENETNNKRRGKTFLFIIINYEILTTLLFVN